MKEGIAILFVLIVLTCGCINAGVYEKKETSTTTIATTTVPQKTSSTSSSTTSSTSSSTTSSSTTLPPKEKIPYRIYGYVYWEDGRIMKGVNVTLIYPPTGEELTTKTFLDGHYDFFLDKLPGGYKQGENYTVYVYYDTGKKYGLHFANVTETVGYKSNHQIENLRLVGMSTTPKTIEPPQYLLIMDAKRKFRRGEY